MYIEFQTLYSMHINVIIYTDLLVCHVFVLKNTMYSEFIELLRLTYLTTWPHWLAAGRNTSNEEIFSWNASIECDLFTLKV